MEATSLTMSRRMVVNVRQTTLTELCSSSQALRMYIEQSHDKVYSCIKGGTGNSGGKRLAISMVEKAWLSEKKEIDSIKNLLDRFSSSKPLSPPIPKYQISVCLLFSKPDVRNGMVKSESVQLLSADYTV
ncbi:hypothetical protein Tco_0567154 [Tanacetum coccineum]